MLVGGVVICMLIVRTRRQLPYKSDSIAVPATPTAVREDSLNTLSDDEIKSQLNDILLVLQGLHYLSVSDPLDEHTQTPILDILKEAMDDRNKVKNLVDKIHPLTKSGNKIIATTALAIGASNLELIKIYDSWVEYLRGVDQLNVNIAELQYQIALFGSSTHDVYLRLVENSSLLPMVAVDFSESESTQNQINQNIKSYFVARIDELFSDIFIENEKFYKETKNRYAIAILVQSYKDFYKK